MIEWNVSGNIDPNDIKEMGWSEGVTISDDNSRGIVGCLRKIKSHTIKEVEDVSRLYPTGPDLIIIDPSTLTGRFTTRQEEPVKRLLASGCVFEVIFSTTLGNREARQSFIDILRQLVKLTKSKSLIISSGAKRSHQLRRSEDFANLFCLAGISYAKAVIIQTETNNYLKRICKTPSNGVITTTDPDDDLLKPALSTSDKQQIKRRKTNFSDSDSSSDCSSSQEMVSVDEQQSEIKKATFDSESDLSEHSPQETNKTSKPSEKKGTNRKASIKKSLKR